jgi:hypothetical protein
VSGTLKPVFHGSPSVLTLSELVRSYNNLVEDATRVMQRIKAMFRARAIATKGTAIYRPSEREQWLGIQTSPPARGERNTRALSAVVGSGSVKIGGRLITVVRKLLKRRKLLVAVTGIEPVT